MRIIIPRGRLFAAAGLVASCWLLGGQFAGADTGAPDAAPPAHVGRPYEATSRHPFDDVEHWKSVFDDPGRGAWQKPAEVVAALGLEPGMCVADLGAGTGYFSRPLSTAVGSTGSVLAVETEPSLVKYLRERAEAEQTENVIPILASFNNPRIPPGSVDLIFMADTFHHLDDRLAYLRNLKRCLKPSGRVAIIDWHKRDLPVGPPLDHKLAREQVVEEMVGAGYVLAAEPDILPYQYFLIFRPR